MPKYGICFLLATGHVLPGCIKLLISISVVFETVVGFIVLYRWVSFVHLEFLPVRIKVGSKAKKAERQSLRLISGRLHFEDIEGKAP